MLKRRRFLQVTTGATLAVLAGACAPAGTSPGPAGSTASAAPAKQTPRRGGTLVHGIIGDPSVGSITLSGDSNSLFSIGAPIHSSLVYLDANRVAQPDLAEGWTIGPDEKTYTFKLRSNAKWHDGKAVTSADVKYTIQEVMAKYSPRFRGYASSLDGVDTPDAQTVVFKLNKPIALFLMLMSPQNACVLPKHIYEGTDPRTNPDNQKPVGSGPFKFQEWVKGDHITVVRNDDYYMPGLPYLDRMVFRIIPDAGARAIAFQKGDTDYMHVGSFPPAQGKQLGALPGVYTDLRGTPAQGFVMLNTSKKPLDDVRVRRAVAMAVDRQAIVDKAYFGFGAKPPVSHLESALAPYHNPNIKLPGFDIAAANKLLDEAGYPKGADGTRFALRIAYDPTYNFGHEVIRDGFAAVGIKGELTPYDVPTITKTVFADGNFDLFNGQTGVDDPALSLLNKYHSSNIGTYYGNGSRYKNAEVDQLLTDGSATANVEKRKTIYWKVQEILASELPAFAVADVSGVDFYGPKLRGYEERAPGRPFYRHETLWRTE